MEWIIEFDRTILFWIQDNLRNVFTDNFFSVITYFGEKGIFWLSMAVILLFFKKTRKCGIMMIGAVALGFFTGECFVKNLVCRNRPFILFEWDVENLLITAPAGFSFPSGHTCASFAASTSIFFNSRKWGIPALCFAFLIAFSRIFLFVHFPSDIIIGMLWGITAAVIVKLIVDCIYKKKQLCNEKQKSE